MNPHLSTHIHRRSRSRLRFRHTCRINRSSTCGNPTRQRRIRDLCDRHHKVAGRLEAGKPGNARRAGWLAGILAVIRVGDGGRCGHCRSCVSSSDTIACQVDRASARRRGGG